MWFWNISTLWGRDWREARDFLFLVGRGEFLLYRPRLSSKRSLVDNVALGNDLRNDMAVRFARFCPRNRFSLLDTTPSSKSHVSRKPRAGSLEEPWRTTFCPRLMRWKAWQLDFRPSISLQVLCDTHPDSFSAFL